MRLLQARAHAGERHHDEDDVHDAPVEERAEQQAVDCREHTGGVRCVRVRVCVCVCMVGQGREACVNNLHALPPGFSDQREARPRGVQCVKTMAME